MGREERRMRQVQEMRGKRGGEMVLRESLVFLLIYPLGWCVCLSAGLPLHDMCIGRHKGRQQAGRWQACLTYADVCLSGLSVRHCL